MNNITRQRLRYVLTDLVTSAGGWTTFYVYRYHVTGYPNWPSLGDFMTSDVVLLGLILSPFVWVGLYAFSGYYRAPLLKSHLEDLQTTFLTVLAGTLAYFFAIVIDDVPLVDDSQLLLLKLPHVSRMAYMQILATMFACVFVPVYAGRLLVTHLRHAAIQSGRAGVRTLVVGSGEAAQAIRRELAAAPRRDGYTLVGSIDEARIGDDLATLVARQDIEAFLLAPDDRTPRTRYGLILRLLPYDRPIRTRPTDEEILSGSVRTGQVAGLPMLEYGASCLPPFRRAMKRLADVVLSALALVLVSPLMAVLALLIKASSGHGPVFYSQERIGRCGHPFRIYKFRTMHPGAEPEGPRLASEGDARITPLGHTLRKYRLDELPQFWNILRGDMSLVGPRPERAHYIERIMTMAPHYCKLLQVRPGLTSWGMVKYGYASSVVEMIERMRYDLMYLDNCTMVMDMKIMGYTVRTVLTGRGI